jgi:DNA-nicking Smr family endonuclease
MIKKTNISDQDQSLFRDAMRGVKPIKHTKLTQDTPPPKTSPIRKSNDEDSDELVEFSDYESLEPVGSNAIIHFSRPGIQHKILRNLRNGKYNVEVTLDLHGKTVAEARELLSQFLFECKQTGIRHVLIIHGKGRETKKPILKNKLNNWLRQTEQVLAFCSATISDGSSGAMYVLLKNPSKK